MKYYIRKKVFEHQLKKSPLPVKLIVGADGDRYPGWLSTEKSFFDITNPDDWEKYFDFGVRALEPGAPDYREEEVGGVKSQVPYFNPDKKITVDKDLQVVRRILAEHVFHFLTEDQAMAALQLMKKYLTDDGRIRIAVPDQYHKDQRYIEYVNDPVHGHKSRWSFQSLTRFIKAAGFKHVQVKEAFDAGGSFNIATWYRIDGYVKRSFWYDYRNMVPELGNNIFWSSLIIDAIK